MITTAWIVRFMIKRTIKFHQEDCTRLTAITTYPGFNRLGIYPFNNICIFYNLKNYVHYFDRISWHILFVSFKQSILEPHSSDSPIPMRGLAISTATSLCPGLQLQHQLLYQLIKSTLFSLHEIEFTYLMIIFHCRCSSTQLLLRSSTGIPRPHDETKDSQQVSTRLSKLQKAPC